MRSRCSSVRCHGSRIGLGGPPGGAPSHLLLRRMRFIVSVMQTDPMQGGQHDHCDGSHWKHRKKIAEALLKAGEKVRALGCSESKLAELKSAGAEALAGDTTDVEFLTKAFRGADAVYMLLPTERQACRLPRRAGSAGRSHREGHPGSGVRYVVALSSVGADL